MKKTSKLNVEYAALTINTDNIEERSEAEYIKARLKTLHYPQPIIRTMEDIVHLLNELERLKIDKRKH